MTSRALLQHSPSSVPDPDLNPDPPDPHMLGLPDPDPLVRGMDPDPHLDPNPDPDPLVRGADPDPLHAMDPEHCLLVS